MFIYFACSITGGRQDEPVYQAIVQTLLEGNHEVPTAHLSGPDVMALEEIVDPAEVYRRDIEWIDSCQALIAEISTPSHGVGYEIAYALSKGKPVLCCHRHDARISKMITGNSHNHLRVRPYRDLDEAVQTVQDFLVEVLAGGKSESTLCE
jgi:nucleoside 2-deoxyribosyltransferase